MKHLTRLFLLGLMITSSMGLAASAPVAKVYRWDSTVNKDDYAFGLAPFRGETMILRPRLLSYGVPMDLTHAYTAYMIYKAVGGTNAYSITGAILNPTNGQVEVVFGAGNELADSNLVYQIFVSSATTTVVGAQGVITYQSSLTDGSTVTTNGPIYILDFAQVQLLNVGYAPFLSSYEINDIRTYLTTIQNGLGDIDARDVTVRGTLNYTNWPAYLARTSQLPPTTVVAAGQNITVAATTNGSVITYTVTGQAGGGGGGGGIGSYTNTSFNGVANTNHADIVDGSNTTWHLNSNGQWSVNVPPETEPLFVAMSNSLSFNAGLGATAYGWGNHALAGYLTSIPGNWITTGGTNSWTIDGVTVGYVTTNGIRLLTGTLQLDNHDLNCNVRLYDGSRTSPSLTPAGHVGTWGLYFRGYNSTYSAAWSQGGVEIGILHGGGITLISTNAYFTGKHAGDGGSLTNVPEPLYVNFATNGLLQSLTITNSGVITGKDAGGSTRYTLSALDGSMTKNGQDYDVRYALAPTNMTGFILTNVFAGVTNILFFSAQGVCTNYIP